MTYLEEPSLPSPLLVSPPTGLPLSLLGKHRVVYTLSSRKPLMPPMTGPLPSLRDVCEWPVAPAMPRPEGGVRGYRERWEGELLPTPRERGLKHLHC